MSTTTTTHTEDLRDGNEGRKHIYVCHDHYDRVLSGVKRTTNWIGTLDQIKDVFGYTLEVGRSWNSRISRNPRTAKAVENAINKSFDVKYGATYTVAYVEIEPYTA